MCKLIREYAECRGCVDYPECINKGRRGEMVRACVAQHERRPWDCPNGGNPDPNNRRDVEKVPVGYFTCTRCQEIIARYQRRLREMGYDQ